MKELSTPMLFLAAALLAAACLRLGGGPEADSIRFTQLLAKQQADGGWSWLRGEASDAFATSQSLYALGLLGRPADEPVVRRARQFLLDTQEEDGSWSVRSTLSDGKGVTPTSRYWAPAGRRLAC